MGLGGIAWWESDPDSGACGKRKRGEIDDIPEIDSGEIARMDCGGGEEKETEFEDRYDVPEIDFGGEIAEFDSGGGEIAKIDEKETRKVDEFDDRYGILEPYKKKKMAFEGENYVYEEEELLPCSVLVLDDDEYNEDDYDATDDEMEEHLDTTPYDHDALLRYISQVRNSSGFDVDTTLAPMLKTGGSPLCFDPIRWPHPDDPGDIDFVNEAAKLAIDGINLDNLEMENKTSFELVEVTKVVTVELPYDLLFLTLAVKKVVEEGEEAEVETIRAVVHHPICEPMELHQWMFFKPDPAEA